MTWKDKVLRAFFSDELEKFTILCEEKATKRFEEKWVDQLSGVRRIIQQRRQGVPSTSLEAAVSFLIDRLEDEERKRDSYATLLWDAVSRLSEEEKLEFNKRAGIGRPPGC